MIDATHITILISMGVILVGIFTVGRWRLGLSVALATVNTILCIAYWAIPQSGASTAAIAPKRNNVMTRNIPVDCPKCSHHFIVQYQFVVAPTKEPTP